MENLNIFHLAVVVVTLGNKYVHVVLGFWASKQLSGIRYTQTALRHTCGRMRLMTILRVWFTFSSYASLQIDGIDIDSRLQISCNRWVGGWLYGMCILESRRKQFPHLKMLYMSNICLNFTDTQTLPGLYG